MARQGWGRHVAVVTGSQDATKQVSKNEWNDDLDTDGVLGFAPETIASASTITPTNSLVKLSGSTSIDTIAITNTSEGDLLWIYTTGSVTLNNTSSPSSDGDIRLLANANKDLSTTTPTVLIRISTFWYEYLTGEQNAVTASSTTTFSNKSIDLTDNTLTGTSLELKTAISDETGSGALVFATSPTLVTPALGTPSALVGTSITGTASGLTAGNVTTNANLTGDVTSSGNATTIATDAVDIAMLSATGTASSSTFLRGDNAWTAVTTYSAPTIGSTSIGSGATVTTIAGLTLTSPVLGTPASGTLTNATGLPVATGLASSTSANLATVISDETGSGSLVFATSPTLVTPALGTPASGVATNLTGTAASLTAGTATTVVDNAITLAKMAGGTDGNLITYDTNGDPAAVATGTATHVLTSNGADTVPTFQAAGGGATVEVVEAVLTSQFSTTSTTLVDVGLSLTKPSITDGHCLAILSCNIYNDTNGKCTDLVLDDDGTNVSFRTRQEPFGGSMAGGGSLNDTSVADGNTLKVELKVSGSQGHVTFVDSAYCKDIPKLSIMGVG